MGGDHQNIDSLIGWSVLIAGAFLIYMIAGNHGPREHVWTPPPPPRETGPGPIPSRYTHKYQEVTNAQGHLESDDFETRVTVLRARPLNKGAGAGDYLILIHRGALGRERIVAGRPVEARVRVECARSALGVKGRDIQWKLRIRDRRLEFELKGMDPGGRETKRSLVYAFEYGDLVLRADRTRTDGKTRTMDYENQRIVQANGTITHTHLPRRTFGAACF